MIITSCINCIFWLCKCIILFHYDDLSSMVSFLFYKNWQFTVRCDTTNSINCASNSNFKYCYCMKYHRSSLVNFSRFNLLSVLVCCLEHLGLIEKDWRRAGRARTSDLVAKMGKFAGTEVRTPDLGPKEHRSSRHHERQAAPGAVD